MCLLKTVTLMPNSFFDVDFRSKAWSVAVANVHKRSCVCVHAAACTHAGAWRWLEIHLPLSSSSAALSSQVHAKLQQPEVRSKSRQLRASLGSRAATPAFAVTPGGWGTVQGLPAEAPLLEELHQGKALGPEPAPPALRAPRGGGAVGWRFSPTTSVLLPVLDTSWFWGRRKRNLADRSQRSSFHRHASMIYQLTGNEKKFPAIKSLILLKQEAAPCHRVPLRETGSSCR